MPMNLELSIQQKDNIVFQNTFSGEQIPENKDCFSNKNRISYP